MQRELFPWNLFCFACEEHEEEHSPRRQRDRERIQRDNERKFLGTSFPQLVIYILLILLVIFWFSGV